MNKLQKSAWINLIFTTVIVIGAGLGFWILVRVKAQGLGHILILLISCSFAILLSTVFSRKKRLKGGLDERERKIYVGAVVWSHGITMLVLVCFCLIGFYVAGAGNDIPAYFLVIILLSCIYISQFVHSSMILMRCMLDEEDE